MNKFFSANGSKTNNFYLLTLSTRVSEEENFAIKSRKNGIDCCKTISAGDSVSTDKFKFESDSKIIKLNYKILIIKL